MREKKKDLPHITPKNAPPPYDEKDGDYVYFADADGQPCADRNPFRPDAQQFKLINAWWLCEAATLAYSAPERVKDIFEKKTTLKQVEFLSTSGGSECFIVSNKEFAIVAFRGSELTPREGSPRNFSEVIKDWVGNADIRTSNSVEGSKVHRGFADGVKRLWEEKGLGNLIAGLSPRKVWFTGHSLGAALATLAAARVLAAADGRLDGLYTFGSPRVGDATFAAAFQAMLARRGFAHYRFVNGDDVVTTVPLLSNPPVVKFKHTGTLKHIDSAGHITEDPSQFEQLKAKVFGFLPVDAGGHLDQRFFNGIPNAIEDHVPTLYSTHIWNAYVEELSGSN